MTFKKLDILLELNGQTNFYYDGKEVVRPDAWRKLERQNWPKDMMTAMGISWEGTTRIYIIPSGVKVNADSFIKLILTKMVRHDFPRLCGDRAKDVILHMDSAPSHVALTTVQWLKNHKVKWIPKLHWMANSLDLAPMDYVISANFERILKKSRARITTELVRRIQRECKKIGVRTC